MPAGTCGCWAAIPTASRGSLASSTPWRLPACFWRCPLGESAVATSGNYLRYRVYNSRRYGHLLHPRHGYPADTALSLTVVAPTAMRADALATAALVMGRDGLPWLRGQPDAEAVMVTRSPSRPDRLLVQASRGLRDRLTLFDGTAIVEADS